MLPRGRRLTTRRARSSESSPKPFLAYESSTVEKVKIAMTSLRLMGVLCVVLLLSATAVTGCTDGEGSSGGTPVPSGDGDGDGSGGDGEENQDNQDNQDNQNNDEPSCDELECGSDEFCLDGECVTSGEGYSCDDPMILHFDSDETQTITHNPSGNDSELDTECSNDGDESPESVFRVAVDNPSWVRVDIVDADHNLVVDLRQESCEAATASVECSQNDYTEQLDPGEEYYLIVEATNSWMVGEYDLELQVEEMACSPAGDWSCDGDTRVQCHGGTEEKEYDCADGCSDGECTGDSCANPIVIEGSQTVSAELDGYSDNLDFESSPTCSTSGESGSETPGQDLIFSLPDLAGGDLVEIEAPSSAYVTAVMDECPDDFESLECLAANSTSGELEWEVPEAGDYFVVMDRFSSSGETGEFSIEIR